MAGCFFAQTQPYRGWLRYGTPDNPAADRDHRIGHGRQFRALPDWGRCAMSLATDDLFVLRTHVELLTLKLQADQILRNQPTNHVCPDTAPCRNCAALLQIHVRINDHLDQLDEAAH